VVFLVGLKTLTMLDSVRAMAIAAWTSLAVFVAGGLLVASYNWGTSYASPIRTATHTVASERNGKTTYLEPKIAFRFYAGFGLVIISGISFSLSTGRFRKLEGKRR